MAIFLSLALPEFLSTPSARRATNLDSVISQLFRFLSTPSARRATTSSSQKYCPDCQFLSTPSARRATSSLTMRATSLGYFYPRPPRGGRLRRGVQLVHIDDISIHALREEGDGAPPSQYLFVTISIHALREEGDASDFWVLSACSSFLSTPSARRATSYAYRWTSGPQHFYPRPPRGGRPTTSPPTTTCLMISIHALREEGDVRSGEHLCWVLQFLSTPSARRATRRMLHEGCHTGISIHALREEGDLVPFCRLSGVPISIHALREEGDSLVAICVSSFLYFYPRPPRGGRHKQLGASLTAAKFLSTPSARRATPLRHHGVPPAGFLSTPSARRATREGPCRCRR